jgi:hypothetical protein
LLEERNLVELFVGDEEIDARDVHVDDTAGADVKVADFAVAHLALGEADGGAGGVDESVGKFAEEFVVVGFAREGDGVAFGFGAESPAVEDGEYERFRSFCHGFSEYTQTFECAMTTLRHFDSKPSGKTNSANNLPQGTAKQFLNSSRG